MDLITRYDRAEDNKGGFCQIRILKRSNFEINQVLYARYRGEGTINISANDTLENVFPICYHTPLLGDYEQPTNSNEFGSYYTQNFQFSVPKDRPNILKEITQLQDEPVAILVKNGNEAWKAIGTEEDWASFSVSQKTGGKPADPNVYIIEINCVSRYLSPFLEFEKREEEIIVPSGCFDGGEGFSHNRTYPIGRRKSYSFGRFNRIGQYKLSYSLDLATRIIIRYNSNSQIIDDRIVQPSDDNFYTFTTNGDYFTVIVEKMNGRRDTKPTNDVGVHPPCIPEV
ncbi:hypothetical protein V9L05_15335 [Bernardetia sp. Wsw4-3y2]|uniref:hypothetical protein n=1 Tax=Bernardetia sp. Wsw4-3y2 TaxID=3127471 RepID=UPI0030CF4320